MTRVEKFNTMPKEWGKDINYRDIAKRISRESREPITFNGVRAIFLKAMKKIAVIYLTEYRPEITGCQRQKLAEKLASSIYFQHAVGEYLHKIWSSKKCQ